MKQQNLIVQNTYRLKTDARTFELAIGRLVDRVERDGVEGVLSYRFYSNPMDTSARGIIEYRDPNAWIGHHDISMPWPEMAALHETAELVEVVFLGPFTSEIEDWIKTSALTARLVVGNGFASGFVRNSDRLAHASK